MLTPNPHRMRSPAWQTRGSSTWSAATMTSWPRSYPDTLIRFVGFAATAPLADPDAAADTAIFGSPHGVECVVRFFGTDHRRLRYRRTVRYEGLFAFHPVHHLRYRRRGA